MHNQPCTYSRRNLTLEGGKERHNVLGELFLSQRGIKHAKRDLLNKKKAQRSLFLASLLHPMGKDPFFSLLRPRRRAAQMRNIHFRRVRSEAGRVSLIAGTRRRRRRRSSEAKRTVKRGSEEEGESFRHQLEPQRNTSLFFHLSPSPASCFRHVLAGGVAGGAGRARVRPHKEGGRRFDQGKAAAPKLVSKREAFQKRQLFVAFRPQRLIWVELESEPASNEDGLGQAEAEKAICLC